MRVSPNSKFVACVKHEVAPERNYLVILPLATGKAVPVATDTNSYPDWSADSRTVYFSRTNSGSEPDLLKGRGIHVGGLFKAEIVDLSGKLVAAPKTQRLANLIFDNRAPVRSLKDGRVLFVSREIRLPGSVSAQPSAALFALEGNRVDTVIHRNEDIAYFETSPEQDQMAVSFGGGGSLIVCKSSGSDVVELCNGKDLRLSGLLPQWRTNQELSYGTEFNAGKGSKPTYSIVLWSRGEKQTRELSKSWGKEANSEITMHRDLFQEAMTGVMEDMEHGAAVGK